MSWPWIVAFVALWATLAVVAAIVIGVLRRVIPLLEASMAQSIGELSDLSRISLLSQVPDFRLLDANGSETSLGVSVTEISLIVLTSSTCGPCQLLLNELDRLAEPVDGMLPILVITDQSDEAHQGRATAAYNVFVDIDRSAKGAFQTSATPYAFTVSGSLVLLEKRVPNSIGDLREMSRSQKSESAAA